MEGQTRGKDNEEKAAKLLYMARLVFLEKLAYTKALWVDIAGTMAAIFIYYFLWRVVFQKQQELAGYTMVQMITYVILSKILSSQFSGGINRTFAQWIYSGEIGSELIRPVSLFTNLFGRRVGEFGFYIIFKAIPVMILSFLILGGKGPAGFAHFVLFFISVCVSIVLMFYFEMIFGIGTIYILSTSAMCFLKQALLELLSGGIVPLAVFPDVIENILNILPFAGMVSVPVNIFLGKYTMPESLIYIMIQTVWCFGMSLAAHWCCRKALKRVVVQGG